MANSRKKNIIYVDTTGDITVDAMRPLLFGVLITPTVPAAKSQLVFMTDETKLPFYPSQTTTVVIKETSSAGTTVFHAILPSYETKFFNFSGYLGGGLELTATFNITTLTNITNVLLYGSWLSPVGKAQ